MLWGQARSIQAFPEFPHVWSPGGTSAALAIVLHELGCLVGLAHVSDQGASCPGWPGRTSTSRAMTCWTRIAARRDDDEVGLLAMRAVDDRDPRATEHWPPCRRGKAASGS
jgi:hypothetical protein